MEESYPNGYKTLWEKEKLVVTSNFSFSHSVFERLVFQGRQKVSLCGNGLMPRPGGSVVSMSDSWPGGCEFDPQLRRLFFPEYFHLSPLQMHARKVVGGFGKKNCVSTQCFRLNKILPSPWDPVPLKKVSPIEFLLSPISSSVYHLFNEDHFGWGIE